MNDFNKDTKEVKVDTIEVKKANVVEANTVDINDLIRKEDVKSENTTDNTVQKGKYPNRRKLLFGLLAFMLIGVLGVINFRCNTENVEAGVAIGSSRKISIKEVGESSDPKGLDHFGMADPILYITLDTTGEGLPAGFDYTADDVDFQISEKAKGKPNHYGAYIPSMDSSSILFVPYFTANHLKSLGLISGVGKDSLRKDVRLLWMQGVGSGEMNEARAGDSTMKIIQSAGVEVSNDAALKSELGSDIFEDGIFYKSLIDDKFEITKWKSLVTNANVVKSLKLWN